MKIIILSINILICLATLIEANEQIEKIIKDSKSETSGRVEEDKKNSKLKDSIKKLNDAEKRLLYDSIVKNMDFKKTDDPFANSKELILIGLILTQTNEKELIKEILIATPPPSVGYLSLGEYLKGLPADILSEVLLDGSILRRNLEIGIEAKK